MRQDTASPYLWQAYLNGEYVEWVVEADDEEGWVDAYTVNPETADYYEIRRLMEANGGDLPTERKHGKVRIEIVGVRE